MEERIILVDEGDCQVGTEEKLEAHRQGKLHRAFSIYIFNKKGELMLQKRHSAKYHSGGLWTNTCCSHPRAGELLQEAVHRRLRQEMGFDCNLNEAFSFIYNVRLDKGLTEHEYLHVYTGEYDGVPALNEEEAEGWKWMNLDELHKDIKLNPHQYTRWFQLTIDRLVQHRKAGTDFFSAEHKGKIDNELEKILPKKIGREWVQKAVGEAKWAYDTAALTKAISEPVWDFLSRGGKRWRPMLMLICCQAAGGNAEQALPFTIIPELIHNGSLIIDDIEDNSELRRGRPVLHKLFGMDVAVNAGNTLYTLPFITIRDSGLPAETKAKAYEIINTQMLKCHLGQATDIWWHSGKPGKVPTEEEYFQMCANKTGSVAEMAAKLGALLGGGTEKQIKALGRFAEAAGVAFQIKDDILNIESSANLGKEYGDDIKEGKMTLLVIHALAEASESEKKRLLEILNMHTSDAMLIAEATAIMKKHGSIEYARKVAAQIAGDVWEKAKESLPESEAKEQLKKMAQMMIKRSS